MQKDTPFTMNPDSAELIKHLCSSHQKIKEELDSVDATDPTEFAALITARQVMFLANEGVLPALVFALTRTLMAVMREADSKQDPGLTLACRMASLDALSEDGAGEESTEEPDDENDQNRTTN